MKLKKQVEDKYGKPTKEPQAQIPKDKFSKPDDENESSDENQDDKKLPELILGLSKELALILNLASHQRLQQQALLLHRKAVNQNLSFNG